MIFSDLNAAIAAAKQFGIKFVCSCSMPSGFAGYYLSRDYQHNRIWTNPEGGF